MTLVWCKRVTTSVIHATAAMSRTMPTIHVPGVAGCCR